VKIAIFGGTGDLAWRKLMPALFQAFRHGSLPAGGRILGVARDDLDDARYRSFIRSRFDEVDLAKRPSADEFERFAQMLGFVRMDLSQPADYARLAQRLAERQADTVVMYLATAPSLFTGVCEQLAAAGLNTARTRLVLEKPLGHDLASNRAINESVRRVLSEKQVFRIDHYLGKPSVQNLFALRFGNALFEPLWRRENIDHIQIAIAEDLGVEKRGGFYDSTGALRDMVQNHALQLLCALAMEPPINAHADAIRTPDFHHFIDHFHQEARAIFNRAAILVGACVGTIMQKLTDEIAVGTMHFDAIKASLFGVFCRLAEICDEACNFVSLKRARRFEFR
jgi:glucose-6-phosphate 1-dehydrogenase